MSNGKTDTPRDLTIDRFRGALVMLMVIGDYIAGISWIPASLKHAHDIGFTIADMVAPAFMFVIALNLGPSLTRRLTNHGKATTYRYFAKRWLIIFAIGFVISTGALVVNQYTGWVVLETLGVAGMITVLVVNLPIWARVFIASGVLVVYQFVLDRWLLQFVLHTGHGGPFGALSWTAFLILATVLADYWRSGLRPYLLATGVLVVIAALSLWIVPISKNRVSLSYVLVALSICAVIWLALKLATGDRHENAGVFVWWGQSALVLYFTHLLLLALVALPPAAWWNADAPIWLVAIQLTVILGVMTWVGRWRQRRR